MSVDTDMDKGNKKGGKKADRYVEWIIFSAQQKPQAEQHQKLQDRAFYECFFHSAASIIMRPYFHTEPPHMSKKGASLPCHSRLES
jgi:hypothetical protein